MKFFLLIFFSLFLAGSLYAKGAPQDKYFHLSLYIGERIELNSYRIGYNGLELGKLNLTTQGIIYRAGSGPFIAGLGPGWGSDGFGPSYFGLFGEVGIYYLVWNWVSFEMLFTHFVGVNLNLRSELLLGVGIHF